MWNNRIALVDDEKYQLHRKLFKFQIKKIQQNARRTMVKGELIALRKQCPNRRPSTFLFSTQNEKKKKTNRLNSIIVLFLFGLTIRSFSFRFCLFFFFTKFMPRRHSQCKCNNLFLYSLVFILWVSFVRDCLRRFMLLFSIAYHFKWIIMKNKIKNKTERENRTEFFWKNQVEFTC